ncbi:MAG: tyrosine-type recombinase/integrase [Acidimicrobiales bacterium]
MRLAELAGLRIEDVDFTSSVVLVVGKGRRPRACPFGSKTAQALDRYVRVRARHPLQAQPWLWLGSKGRLTDSGVAQLLRRRSTKAGIEAVHPHHSATPSPTAGWHRAATRATLSGSPVGAAARWARCSNATERRRRTKGRGRHTAG